MKGKRNLITDVPGVFVGHQTIHRDTLHTGVTAILPQADHLFERKLPAALQVINGFGKSAGLIQVAELGNLETPLVLTNTFGVGTAINALIKKMLAEHPAIGDTTGTVNPIVLECNDGEINDIRQMGVTEQDVQAALANVGSVFEQGAVGAGTGMCCHDLKGGIGSASRVLTFNDESFTLGALVLTNYGQLEDLVVYGYPIGPEILAYYGEKTMRQAEKGSVIVILATDLPLSSRQLTRISKRASVGITRTGAFIGNGSGEIALSFSTANRIAHFDTSVSHSVRVFNENQLDALFQATADVVEEAVICSLVYGAATTKRNGTPVRNLLDCVQELQAQDASPTRAELLKKLRQVGE
ncbi:MAG: P1 family peptidase [Enterococcus sp.]